MKNKTSFSSGVHAFCAGFSIFKEKGLRRFAYGPMIINILIFSIFLYIGYDYTQSKVSLIEYHLPDFLSFLQSSFNYLLSAVKLLIIILVMLAILIIIALSGTLVANLIAAPFNVFLAEKVDHQQTGFIPPSMNLLKMSGLALMREFHKFFYYLPRALLAGSLFLILYVIPIFNLFAPIILYLFGAWMMAFQYLDYAADNRQISITGLKQILKKNRSASIGFGFMCMIFSSIPILNLIIIPVCVAGAVKLWSQWLAESQP
ncbi:MAG: sulfate transporter CysZ [Gammaproteobacteria bacterium]